MNYGQQQAVMIIAGERLGFTMMNANTAKDLLNGKAVHVMHSASMSNEATELHNKIRKDVDLVAKANVHCVDIISEYNLK